MRRLLCGLAVAAALAQALPAPAYQINVHRRMSVEAMARSTLVSRIAPLGRDLRVVAADSFLGDGGLYLFGLTLFEVGRPVDGWVSFGAMSEDDTMALPPARWRNHFYNPRAPEGERGLAGVARDSLQWATSDRDQEWSLENAREYFYRSLTAPVERERKKYLARLYRGLGQVIHLVQDLGQPQHTRNDSHGFVHFYESYTSSKLNALPYSGYGNVSITQPAQLWTTPDRKGLADYTNRNFVTAGTNWRGTMSGNLLTVTTDPNFPEPVAVGQPSVVPITSLLPEGEAQPLRGDIWFVAADVVDAYTGQATRNPRASSYSLFTEDLRNYGFQMEFALNRFNYDAAHPLLIPQAVGYSAGLLDHFFRGTIELAEPDDVVYAMIDPTQKSSFDKIKLKVRNTTQRDAFQGGTLWVVAKYHRNTCYSSDLRGEAGGDNAPDIVACRSTDGETAISAPKTGFSLATGEQRALSFDFSANPIPVDATDLYLQAVYRGPLGAEQDAVAFGFKDLLEPTHIAYFNATDVTEIADKHYTFDKVLAGIAAGDPTFSVIDRNGDKTYGSGDYLVTPYDFANVQVSFYAPAQRVVATIPSLPKSRYARMTVLTDRARISFYADFFGYNPPSAYNQLDETGRTFYVTSAAKLRGNFVTDALVIRYCPPGTTCNGDLGNLPDSTAPADGNMPLPVSVIQKFP